MLMLETGMRPEEVYWIRRENVDLVRGNIQIPYGKTAAARRLLRQLPCKGNSHQANQAPLRALLFPCEGNPERSIPNVNNAHDGR